MSLKTLMGSNLKPKANWMNSATFLPSQGLTVNGASLGVPSIDGQMPNSFGTQTPTASLGTPSLSVPGSGFMDAGYNPTAGLELAGKTPAAGEGGWFDMKGKGGMLLGAGQIGLGVWNAYQQGKQNDFMKSYYQNQMNLQKQDFANQAHSLNGELSAREGRRLDAANSWSYDSAANKAGRDDHMKTWGVKETF